MSIPDKREYYSRSEVAEGYYHFSFGGRSGEWVEEREAVTVRHVLTHEGAEQRRLSGPGLPDHVDM